MKTTTSAWIMLSLFSAVFFWGLSFVATKLALETMSPFILIFCRYLLAFAIISIFFLKSGFPRLELKEHGKVFLVALFEPGLYFMFETYGLKYTSAPKASLIIATMPLFVTLFAAILLGEKARRKDMMAVFISLGGISVLILSDPAFNWQFGGPIVGDVLIFCAVISSSLYAIMARYAAKSRSALEITRLQIMYGAMIYLPFFLWDLPGLEWESISLRSVGALVYLSLFATVIAFFCFNFALTRIPAGRAAISINCIPLVTAICAWFVIGEKLTMLQMAGGVLVLGAVLMPHIGSGRRLAPAAAVAHAK